ncbi:MAG: hypothetical protein U0163_20930 [Gemmatimonadaceae bacterium]
MRSTRLLLAAFAATLTACASSPPILAPVAFTLEQAADSIPIGYGQTVAVGNILVSFTDVADSRCPSRVVCVWAGDGVVSLSATLTCTRSTPPCSVPSQLLTLHTMLEPKSVTYGGLAVRLLGLKPYPEQPGSLKNSDYVAWLQLRSTS